MKGLISLLALCVLLIVPTVAPASTWTIDPEHSSVGFKVRHMMVSNVKGEFGSFHGTVAIDDRDVTKSKIEVVIDTPSINTGVAKRDAHLKSADFFDVAKYPLMTFVSKSIRKNGDSLLLTGDLAIHGVTREVTLNVEGVSPESRDPWGNIRRGVSASTKINRRDYGLVWNAALETGGVVVGDEVSIILEVEMIKK